MVRGGGSREKIGGPSPGKKNCEGASPVRPDKKYYVFPVTNDPPKNRVGRSENIFFFINFF